MSGIIGPLSGKFFQGPFLLANTLRSVPLGADMTAVLTELGSLNRTSSEKSLDVEEAITTYHGATSSEAKHNALGEIAYILERDAIKLAPLVAQVSKKFLGTVRFETPDKLQATIREAMGAKTGAALLVELEKKLSEVEQTENAHYRSSYFQVVAYSLAKDGFKEKAVPVFEKAITAAEQIEDIYDRCRALPKIASALAAAGLGEKAVPLFNQLIAVAEKTENTYDRSEALRKIAFALAEMGLGEKTMPVFEQLITAAEKIENTTDRSRAFQSIAYSLARVGLKEKAVLVFERAVAAAGQITNDYNRSLVFQVIKSALEKTGLKDRVPLPSGY